MTANNGMEHERRFAPQLNEKQIQNLLDDRFASRLITQAYLGDGQKTRIREELCMGVYTYTQTRKTGSGISRTEEEVGITESDFHRLLETAECSLAKTRYFIPFGEHNIELNIFHGALDGYHQIEVEFDSHEAAVAFVPPAWFGPDVTDNDAHSNYSLAKHGKPA